MNVRVLSYTAAILVVIYLTGLVNGATIGQRSTELSAIKKHSYLNNIPAFRQADEDPEDTDSDEDDEEYDAEQAQQSIIQQQQQQEASAEDSEEEDDDDEDEYLLRRKRSENATELPVELTEVTEVLDESTNNTSTTGAPSRKSSVLILIRDALKKVTTELPTQQVATNALHYFQLFEHFLQQTIEQVIGDVDDEDEEATTIKSEVEEAAEDVIKAPDAEQTSAAIVSEAQPSVGNVTEQKPTTENATANVEQKPAVTTAASVVTAASTV